MAQESMIDMLIRTAKAAEDYAVRCYTAAKTLGWTGTHGPVKHAQKAAPPKKRATAAMRHYHQQRQLASPATGTYAELWAQAQTLPDGFVGSDLTTEKRNQNHNAVVSWRRHGFIVEHEVDGVFSGYRIADHLRRQPEPAREAQEAL